eukprot:8467566-Karenia_brevis.AAC.1
MELGTRMCTRVRFTTRNGVLSDATADACDIDSPSNGTLNSFRHVTLQPPFFVDYVAQARAASSALSTFDSKFGHNDVRCLQVSILKVLRNCLEGMWIYKDLCT